MFDEQRLVALRYLLLVHVQNKIPTAHPHLIAEREDFHQNHQAGDRCKLVWK